MIAKQRSLLRTVAIAVSLANLLLLAPVYHNVSVSADSPDSNHLKTADDVFKKACEDSNASSCGNNLKDKSRLGAIGTNIINTTLYMVGILAVAMIVFSGARFVMASGDKTRLEQSRRILIYSVVGLMVALMAYAIVNFVLSKF